MEWKKINMDQWNRAAAYRHFMTEVPCAYSMTVSLDITGFYRRIKEEGLRLFPAFLYGLSRVVNRHEEFRMACNASGEPGYYTQVNPSYTVFHPEWEGFTTVWTEYREDFSAFYREYLADREEYRGKNVSKPSDEENQFPVSCIPWTTFSSFHLSLPGESNFLLPIFTIGKYAESQGKLLLPLAIQVHHAACDGYHVSRLVEELQEWLNGFLRARPLE